MFVERASKFLSLFMPAIWNIPNSEKSIYLTFDDGPCPEVTPQLLDILDQYNIKATFFCIGNNIKKHYDIFQQIIYRGHCLGNHTMNHLKGFNTNTQEYLKDISEAQKLIGTTIFRPPYGRITPKQFRLLKKKYKIVMWDVITRDYNTKLNPDKCFSIVKKFTRSGSIIVFHDSKKAAHNMLNALPKSIEWLIAEGYQFKTIV